jgi:hypothetical protein
MAAALRKYHSFFYIGGIMLLAASLPLSPFFISVAQIILIINWLAEGKFKTRLQAIRHRRTILFFLLIMAVHFAWLIPTQDFAYAMKDIKIKLPLIILPLILGTGRRLRDSELKMILVIFTAAVITSSFFSIYRLATVGSMPMYDLRNISVFISHIRLSLLVNIAIFSLLHLLITGLFQWQRVLRNALWLSLAWLILFLFILQSITGIIVFIVTGTLFLLRFSHNFEKEYWYIRTPLFYGMAGFVSLISIYTLAVMLSFSNKPVSEDQLHTHTLAGNPYVHYPENRQMENSNYVWINICETELKQEWFRRSSLDYDGHDLRGHEIRNTIIRYLASRGLPRDAEGLSQLSETDILNIEHGMANHIYQYNKWLYPRIYQIIWEIDNYRKGGNPSGHSFAQRFEYWKAGFNIIKTNFWFGVGTGDVRNAYVNEYAAGSTRLAPEWQLRAHNQFLTFVISFGITGFLIVMFGMISPFLIEKRETSILAFVFVCIALVSMLTEDTLETQAGATFFAFFYALFIFAQEKNDSDGSYAT